MGLRTVGRWLYHAITSSEKRPYIQSDLFELEAFVAKATEDRDVFKLFAILDELKYRISSPAKRDQLVKQIISILGEYEGILLAPSVNHAEIAAARRKFEVNLELLEQEQARQKREERDRQRQELAAEQLRREEERKESERKAKEAAAEKERLEAEARARQEEAERKEAERQAREAAAEKERLEAEARARQEEAERKEAERQAKEAVAEKARLEAEAKAQREAEEKARLEAEAKAQREEAERKEAERQAKEAVAEKARLEAEAKAQREAEEKARLEAEAKLQREEAERKEAERQAKEAVAEKARLEAEAKAQREAEEKARLEAEAKVQREEAERKEAERQAKEAAAEKARLEAEAKAQREAEEKARLEAEAKVQREEAERKEAERQAKEAASEQAGREEQKEQEEDSTALQLASKEEPLRQQDLQEQIKRFFAARPLTEAKQPRNTEEEPNSEEEFSQSTLEDERDYQSEEKLASADESTALVVDARIDETQADPEAQRARIDASRDAEADRPRQIYAPSRQELKRSAEEIREERRELARLRRLEREGKEADQSGDEPAEADLDIELEEADQFAPFLRAIPAHWSDWSEQHWNIKLLDYCFVQKATENSSQGIPSTEEDLAFVTGDRESDPAEIAQALVKRVREFSVNRGLSPARLLIKRLETWDYKKPSPPRYFAFLWTTCLIAQGFPSPFEKGEFHKRYARDDVYGANETQFLSGYLPAAWENLSEWLDRDDIFDAQAHRRLILPKTDPRRSIISHSWKLSFPCRSDRKKLHDLLGRVKAGKASPAIVDLQLISTLLYQGKFTPEFTVALKQQIDLVQRGNQVEEWLSAIIQREIEAQGISQAVSGRKGKPGVLTGIPPKVMLYLDDDDCYLELVLPSQTVAVDKPRRFNSKTYCAIKLEANERLPQVVAELDINENQEDLIIPELRTKLENEDEEYVLKLRHEGLDNAALAEWSCEGLPSSKPYILFNSETNQIINDAALSGNTLFLLFRRHWDFVLSDGIEAESEEPIGVSRPRGWLLLELAKTSPPQESETISLTNDTGERFDICWVDSDVEKSNSRPLLQGLSIPGQSNRFVMLPESPELWLPPAVTDAEIEMYKIEDDEFFMPIGSIQVPSTESWQQAGVRSQIAGPGHYSIRLSYFDILSERHRRWSKLVLIVEEPDIESIYPTPLQAKYSYKDRLKVLDLERDVSPLVFQETQAFWNAEWLIHGLWAHEKIRVRLDGDGESHSPVLSADNSGSCKIPISAFEPYLLSKESARLSIQRQGFISHYDLAVIIGIPIHSDQASKQDQYTPAIETNKRPAQRRRLVDRVELVVYGDRGSFDIQKMMAEELKELLEERFVHLDARAIEYPEGKFARGTRFVFHRMSFPDIENECKEKLRAELDSLVKSIGGKSCLAFSAEWSRGRE
jgi:hypothetical protein